MTPSENIYRSDRNVVDGLVDVEQFAEDFTNDSIDTLRDMMEDDQYESVLYDDVDDGQPAMYDEMQDYYGGDDWDHGQFDMPEDWSI